MKSMLFFMLFNIDDINGNNSKLIQQINTAERMNYKVYYLGYSKSGIYLCHRSKRKFLSKTFPVNKNFLKRMQLFVAMLKLLHTNIHFDYCYVRKMITTINYGRCLKRLHKLGTKVVVEIPTYPDYEEIKRDKRQYRRIAFFFLKLIDKHYSKYVDLFALIGEPSNNYFGRKAINIQNGIDTSLVSPWIKETESEEINLLTVAYYCSWHGYERLIKGLKNYYDHNGERKITIHFVGKDCDGSLKEWLDLAKSLGVYSNIVFHGTKYGVELDEIVNCCDVAISSLGEYKKGINNATELKMLNYCARGIPFIYCTNFANEEKIAKYCLKVENNSNPVDFNKILSFIDSLSASSSSTKELRSFCKSNFGWEKQIDKVIRELDEC